MTALASMIDSNDPEEIDRIIREGIPDPVGTFYRFSLAGSQLRRAKKPPHNGAVAKDAPAHPAATAATETSSHETHFHRPDYPPGRPRQDRHLPRRGGRSGQLLLADSRAARLRAVLRGPAGRGDAQPHRPHLRRLPRGPPHGGHQGPGRRLPRRSAPGGQEAPRAFLQHFLYDRSHHASSTRWAGRTSSPAPPPRPPSATSSASSRRSAWTSPARCSRCAATGTR